jgi:hypothetical protein
MQEGGTGAEGSQKMVENWSKMIKYRSEMVTNWSKLVEESLKIGEKRSKVVANRSKWIKNGQPTTTSLREREREKTNFLSSNLGCDMYIRVKLPSCKVW